MSKEYVWESKSLEQLHKIRKEMEDDADRNGLTITEWVRSKGEVNLEQLCNRLGLHNLRIVEGTKGRVNNRNKTEP